MKKIFIANVCMMYAHNSILLCLFSACTNGMEAYLFMLYITIYHALVVKLQKTKYVETSSNIQLYQEKITSES